MRARYPGPLLTVALACMTLIGAGPAPASAADLPEHYRPLTGYSRTVERYRSGEASLARAESLCPPWPPADYRPRLVGEPGCYAARPFRMSNHLYGTIIRPQWGAEY